MYYIVFFVSIFFIMHVQILIMWAASSVFFFRIQTIKTLHFYQNKIVFFPFTIWKLVHYKQCTVYHIPSTELCMQHFIDEMIAIRTYSLLLKFHLHNNILHKTILFYFKMSSGISRSQSEPMGELRESVSAWSGHGGV